MPPSVRMPDHGKYSEVTIPDQHRIFRQVFNQRFCQSLFAHGLPSIHRAEVRSHRERRHHMVHHCNTDDGPVGITMLIARRRESLEDRRRVRQLNRTAIYNEQPVPQCAPV